jgi:hypothetical protein
MQFERRDDIDKGARSGRRLTRTAAGASALLVLAGAGVAACGTGTPSSSGGFTTTTAPTSGDTTAPSTTSSSTTTTAPPAPPLSRGQQGAGSAIPWSEVGAGWSLALWSSSASAQQDTVFVVDPGGGRYAAASIPAANYPEIADWSGDKQRVLIASATAGTSGEGTTITDLDLATGATVGSFNVANAGIISDISFTRPDGLAIVAASYGPHGGAADWTRYSPTGKVELAFPSTFPKVGSANANALYTPDGDDIVIGAAHGLAVVENSGKIVSELPVRGATSCSVLRWWQPDVALASCYPSSGPETFLQVPLSGAAPITITSTPEGPTNIWQADGALYAQEAACGTLSIAKLGPTGSPTIISVPGTLGSDSEVVVGANNNDLLVRATSSCDTAGRPVEPSLLWFDLATNTTTVILGAPLNGGSVESAFLYDAQSY